MAAVMLLFAVVWLGSPLVAAASMEVAAPMAQESPYQAPFLADGEGPSVFGPFTALPIWAQTALFSGGISAISFLALTGIRRLWDLASVQRGPQPGRWAD